MSIYRIRLIESLVYYIILVHQEVISIYNYHDLKTYIPITHLCVDPHDHIV
jgi:hypothetical protein